MKNTIKITVLLFTYIASFMGLILLVGYIESNISEYHVLMDLIIVGMTVIYLVLMIIITVIVTEY